MTMQTALQLPRQGSSFVCLFVSLFYFVFFFLGGGAVARTEGGFQGTREISGIGTHDVRSTKNHWNLKKCIFNAEHM